MNGVLHAITPWLYELSAPTEEDLNAKASELRELRRTASSISQANGSPSDTRRLTDRGSRSADDFESAGPCRPVSLRVDLKDMADLDRQERVLPDLPL